MNKQYVPYSSRISLNEHTDRPFDPRIADDAMRIDDLILTYSAPHEEPIWTITSQPRMGRRSPMTFTVMYSASEIYFASGFNADALVSEVMGQLEARAWTLPPQKAKPVPVKSAKRTPRKRRAA